VTSPSTGTIRVPAGITIIHRGIESYTSVQTDFTCTASNTYHVRWTPGGGFTMTDVTDGTYNPSAKAETATDFDSTYDDMLVARVVTNSSNVATIDNLANRNLLIGSWEKNTLESQSGTWAGLPELSEAVNWGRTPQYFVQYANSEVTNGIDMVTQLRAYGDRYTAQGYNKGYGYINGASAFYTSGELTVGGRA